MTTDPVGSNFEASNNVNSGGCGPRCLLRVLDDIQDPECNVLDFAAASRPAILAHVGTRV